MGEFFWRGVARTYLYELADQGTDKAQREQNFGLLRHDMSEKPAYVALRNLLQLLKEPKNPKAAPLTPVPLDYTLALAPDVHAQPLGTTVLEKRDGTYILLLWQQVSVYDAATKTRIQTPPVELTCELTQPFDVRVYLPTHSTAATETHAKATSLKLKVPAEMLAIELSPVH